EVHISIQHVLYPKDMSKVTHSNDFRTASVKISKSHIYQGKPEGDGRHHQQITKLRGEPENRGAG
ncbi:MAG: hypothetical protein AB1649_04470, partial [Chloroflexota bacterium]